MGNKNFKEKVFLIIIGLFMSLLLIELVLRTGGFIYLSLKEYKNYRSFKGKEQYTILCLGESTTDGQWPGPLEEILNRQYAGIEVNVVDKGMPATNTGIVCSRLNDYIKEYNPNMIIAMMGINDNQASVLLPVIPSKQDKSLTGYFRSLRIYKLLKLIGLSISEKNEEKKPIHGQSHQLIEKTPENFDKKAFQESENNVRLGWKYHVQEKYGKAAEKFRRAITLYPKNVTAYIGAGWCYNDRGNHEKAEQMFKQALSIDPELESPYIDLGWCYKEQGKLDKAEKSYNKALTINPNSYDAYIGLGWLYVQQSRHVDAELIFGKAVELDSECETGYIGLGRCSRDQKKYNNAEKYFKKAILINPENIGSYIELGALHIDAGNNQEAETIFEKARSLDPKNEAIIHRLISLQQSKESRDISEQDSVVFDYYVTSTARNYKKIKDKASEKNIKLICVQYPLRRIESLKKMLEPHDGILFVDNEKVFKDRVSREGYDEYFIDRFSGDFGHCTYEGNRLIAENIAKVILDAGLLKNR
ncbi:tetratricopeptide repeat protein [Elusimicrobiota bacterium]